MARKTEEFWGKGRVQIDFLRNPFDAEKYHVPANVGDYFLYFGRLIDEKGVDVLMEAARLRPEARVVVVGDGPDLAKLEAEAAGMDNVDVVGPAWGDELAKWLHGARAVVVPSVWHENFPYVIFQAFAASTPVIGSRRGGIPELIEAGDHGWTYEATDAAALADRMGEVLALPDTCIAQMGAAAADYTRREFNDDSLYATLMKIYQRVVT
jgi:glycosyltransferase involved in cell wall biosynthesis